MVSSFSVVFSLFLRPLKKMLQLWPIPSPSSLSALLIGISFQLLLRAGPDLYHDALELNTLASCWSFRSMLLIIDMILLACLFGLLQAVGS